MECHLTHDGAIKCLGNRAWTSFWDDSAENILGLVGDQHWIMTEWLTGLFMQSPENPRRFDYRQTQILNLPATGQRYEYRAFEKPLKPASLRAWLSGLKISNPGITFHYMLLHPSFKSSDLGFVF